MSKLLPCPFCGSDDLDIADYEVQEGKFFSMVVCDKCTATGPEGLTQFEARDKWNKAPRNAWQPIETAPKDGTKILVWAGGEAWKVYRRRLLNGGFAWCIDEHENGRLTFGDDYGVTHWLPLPPAAGGSR